MKKRGVVYLPFLMVLILIFSLIVNSNYSIRNIDVYLEYENISEKDKILPLNEFVNKFENYKNEYYSQIDNGFLETELTFLEYIKNNNIKLFGGNLYILDFMLENKINPNNDKMLFYYSDENREGYYFYAKESGRNINLDLAHIFRI